MNNSNFKIITEDLLETFLAAGKIAQDISNEGVKIEIKPDNTPVTNGDLAKGVKDLGNKFEVTTFALHKSQNIIQTITNIYNK